MGDIPERSIFRQPVLQAALVPYLEIAQGSLHISLDHLDTRLITVNHTAVRIGDVAKFNTALETHQATFAADGNATLVLRLRHNVIKTALRTISLAYSRIPLSDVSQKLHLDSEEDAEYIVAKAIRDGVIEAVIDHEHGFMKSKESSDVYATNEPQVAFDTRIKFLLELHNQSVKVRHYLCSDDAAANFCFVCLGHEIPPQRSFERVGLCWRSSREGARAGEFRQLISVAYE